MTENQTPSTFGRRELLRNGGIALSLGALLAACGSDRSGPEEPGKIGVELLPEEEAVDLTVDDAVLLRTLQSLEYATVEMVSAIIASGAVSGNVLTTMEGLIAEHERHAAEAGALVTQAGGTPYECPNPFAMDRIVEPLIAALETSDDAERDALEIANGFESMMTASYQAIVEQITEASLRPGTMTIGNETARQAAVLALAVDSEAVSPELATIEDEEFTVFYAIPATFGQLTGITLVVGAPDEEGARLSVSLQTPAENTFVYNDVSC